MRVVVADDAVILREGLARLLAEAGFEVAGLAADGEELLALVDRERPDVAIVSEPRSASTRSARPRSPEPPDGSAPPTPSSATSITRVASRAATRTWATDACAYLLTLVSASATR